MKVVDNRAKSNNINIEHLTVGTVFEAPRSKDKSEMGLYMKVDKSTFPFGSKAISESYAVNLKTGQLRRFQRYAQVVEVKAYLEVED